MLRPQDFLVTLHRLLHPEQRLLAQMATGLRMSVSVVHRALANARAASLVTGEGEAIRANVLEFAVHGARYSFFPVRFGANVRGVATAGAAPGLGDRLVGSATIVWPAAEGKVRGEGLEPIHASAPRLVADDPAMYLVLAAVDLLRVGGAREREVAAAVLRASLGGRG